MEKGFGYNQHLHPLSPNLNILDFSFDTGHLNTEPAYRNPHSFEDSTLRTAPMLPVSGLQQLKEREPNDPWNWFYQLPHFHPAFGPVLNSASKEKFPGGSFDFGQQRSPTMGITSAQKRFLVFDQSGDKTTLIYSSGVHAPVQCGASWVPNPPNTYNNLSNEERRDSIYPLRPSVSDESVEDNSRDVMEDEMREDTEELNALLCSDNDSDFSEDDEETSTGHSPSTMTDNGIQNLARETGEEVDSFAGPSKRQKLLDGGYDVPPNKFTASSLKTFASSALEYDAESGCGDRNKQLKKDLGSRSGGKRSRNEKIRETVSILQSIIPSVNGKDAIAVIDEAIHYLRSLKFGEAKPGRQITTTDRPTPKIMDYCRCFQHENC